MSPRRRRPKYRCNIVTTHQGDIIEARVDSSSPGSTRPWGDLGADIGGQRCRTSILRRHDVRVPQSLKFKFKPTLRAPVTVAPCQIVADVVRDFKCRLRRPDRDVVSLLLFSSTFYPHLNTANCLVRAYSVSKTTTIRCV